MVREFGRVGLLPHRAGVEPGREEGKQPVLPGRWCLETKMTSRVGIFIGLDFIACRSGQGPKCPGVEFAGSCDPGGPQTALLEASPVHLEGLRSQGLWLPPLPAGSWIFSHDFFQY